MPRCLDPGSNFELYLDSDADKPESDRPVFVFRVLSMGEWMDAEGGADKKFIQAAIDILRSALVGWRNMVRDGQAVEFDRQQLPYVVDAMQVVELLEKLQLSYTDKKKLSLQPTSTQANCAPTAGVENV